MNRTCDGCAECCKGWLSGNSYGHDFYPGKPCFFLQKSCSIYEKRPDDPCKSYRCHWLSSNDLPMWMRPDLSNALVTYRKYDNVEYFEILECGKKMDSSVLSWFIIWALNNQKNIKYQISGGFNKIGTEEFMNAPV